MLFHHGAPGKLSFPCSLKEIPTAADPQSSPPCPQLGLRFPTATSARPHKLFGGRNPQHPVLDQGYFPSSSQPPRHHRTELERDCNPVSGERCAPVRNATQPTRRVFSAMAARRVLTAVAARRVLTAVAARRVLTAVAARRVLTAVAARRVLTAVAARRVLTAVAARRVLTAMAARRVFSAMATCSACTAVAPCTRRGVLLRQRVDEEDEVEGEENECFTGTGCTIPVSVAAIIPLCAPALAGHAGSQPAAPVPFFPEKELTRSWMAHFTARNDLDSFSPSLPLKEGYMAVPPVEWSVTADLCPAAAVSGLGSLISPRGPVYQANTLMNMHKCSLDFLALAARCCHHPAAGDSSSTCMSVRVPPCRRSCFRWATAAAFTQASAES
ncbi:hypothetical protein PO909_032530 [Leuciscus waleckii]